MERSEITVESETINDLLRDVEGWVRNGFSLASEAKLDLSKDKYVVTMIRVDYID